MEVDGMVPVERPFNQLPVVHFHVCWRESQCENSEGISANCHQQGVLCMAVESASSPSATSPTVYKMGQQRPKIQLQANKIFQEKT